MTVDITIDTNVILFATEGHDSVRTPACARIFFTVLQEDNYKFAIDAEYKILEEYKKNLSDKRSNHTELFEELIKKQAYGRTESEIFRVRIPIHEGKIEELSQKGFHENDLIFVRTAPNTESGAIVSTDSESLLDEEYKNWIEDNLQVEVYSPEEACDSVL
ncbi:hypothetical protein [Halosimplex marinum]|uniref:hypothetical protein n=1 Tax=Halosimplex marinum TaxID=3396620 RepID=UPI003F5447E2